MLAGDGIVTLPGVYDCVSARAAVQSGFEVVFTSGCSISASTLGLPDYGFMTASEMLYSVSRIANCVEAPLIADIDTGYGNPLNVMRTVGDVVNPRSCRSVPGRPAMAEALRPYAGEASHFNRRASGEDSCRRRGQGRQRLTYRGT